MTQSQTPPLKVGALATQTGLSVRTLHHYDEIGLLVPSQRTPAGHRLYTYDDVQRLQQIQSLRATGFPLDEIRRLLHGGAFSAQRVIQLHLDRLQAQLAQTQRLTERLQQLARHLDTATQVPLTDLCRIIEATIMMEKYFTPEQLQDIQARGATMGAEQVRNVEQAWGEIIPAVRAHMAKGTSPDDPDLQALASRWRELVNAFTGGNREIAANVRAMYQQEHAQINAVQPNTPDPAMFAYMGEVFKRIGGGPG
ncbi:MAG TPA: MerR family transcriptional regulator [Gemmatimonas sp.]|uniref:MerR family transcriptional regulator n=1 Tax=Gemmatimonas sp. TaxID=1962908 RepID=UPI002EDA6BD4